MKEIEAFPSTLDPADAARLEAEKEALQFECTLLEREVLRLTRANRSLELTLETAERERDGFRDYSRAIEHSRTWRIAQKLRGWIGRRW
jgi:hypothetical protein